MISVIRNTHMPIMEASACCSMSAKWWRRSVVCVAMAGGLSLNGHPLFSVDLVVVVGFPGHDGSLVEVERGGWRTGHPLQARRTPGILVRQFAVAHRPQEINHGQQVTNRENGRARGREHIQYLEFRRVLPVTARHSEIAEHKLGEKGQVESDEDYHCRQLAPEFRIHAPRDFRPPEVHTA